MDLQPSDQSIGALSRKLSLRRARAGGLHGTLFARTECQRTLRRHRPDFHRRAVVQARKFFGDLRSLVEASHLEQEKTTDRFFRFCKRAVRDGTTFLL